MTTLKTLAVAAALMATPTLSLAMGCANGKHDQQVQSCAPGSTLDAATGTCTPITTG